MWGREVIKRRKVGCKFLSSKSNLSRVLSISEHSSRASMTTKTLDSARTSDCNNVESSFMDGRVPLST